MAPPTDSSVRDSPPPGLRTAASAEQPRRALVVGASSGIGAALVRRLAADGASVAAVARRADRLEALAESCRELPGCVVHEPHDVSHFGQVPELFERLVSELGGLDLMIFSAAIMPAIEPGEYDTEKDLDMVAVNLGGCIAWTNEAARLFDSQRHGTIVGISSIAGERGRKGNPVYGTTKAAMNHYLEALRNRLADAGVHVCTIKPGFVETAMVEAARAQGRRIEGAISADAAADAILRAARRKRDEVFVPFKWRIVGFVVRHIPSFLFKRLHI